MAMNDELVFLAEKGWKLDSISPPTKVGKFLFTFSKIHPIYSFSGMTPQETTEFDAWMKDNPNLPPIVLKRLANKEI
jgi:hypothetical protein